MYEVPNSTPGGRTFELPPAKMKEIVTRRNALAKIPDTIAVAIVAVAAEQARLEEEWWDDIYELVGVSREDTDLRISTREGRIYATPRRDEEEENPTPRGVSASELFKALNESE